MKRVTSIPPSLLAVAFCITAAAPACPICDSDTGEAVRAGIFNAGFARNLFATLSPFAVFLTLAAAVHFEWPRPHAKRKGLTDGPDTT